ncbi:hypothetical protein IJG78_01955, partial [Candidatus Saccharibacteria bacterium]|nr:hypothetical protein [Candidatus Saccharibacteria bacterium]
METTSKGSHIRQILNHRNITLTFSIFFIAFVVTFLSFSIFTPISSSDAATVTANIESSGYKITVKSSDVAMNLTTTPTGATTFAKDTIITNTNSPS